MKHTLKIKGKIVMKGDEIEISTEDARELYDQLREVFVTPERVVYIDRPAIPQYPMPPIIINPAPQNPWTYPYPTITCQTTGVC